MCLIIHKISIKTKTSYKNAENPNGISLYNLFLLVDVVMYLVSH